LKAITWVPLKTKIIGLQKANRDLEKAGPGGLLGVMTELDTNLTKADYLAGSVAGVDLPPTLSKLTLKFTLFEKLFDEKIEPIRKGEQLMLNAGTGRTVGVVVNVKKDVLDIDLKLPVCANKKDRVVLSRKISERWRLIGYSEIV
jgi:translation initiation factor 2 subunit 3